MKKIYSVLAAALAVSVSASAALNLPTLQKMPENMTFKMPVSEIAPGAVKKAKKASKKVACPVDQIYGAYFSFSAQWSDDDDVARGTLEIRKSETPGNVIVSGFIMGYDLECPYDPTTGELTIKAGAKLIENQNFGTGQDGNPVIGDLEVCIYQLEPFIDDKTGAQMVRRGDMVESCKIPFIGDLTTKDKETGEEKVLYTGVFDDSEQYNLIQLLITKDGVPTGYFWPTNAGYGNTWVPVGEYFAAYTNLRETIGGSLNFKYNAADWEDKGEASFTDGFFYGLFNDRETGETIQVPAYQVKCLRYKNNPNFVWLDNPYGKESGYGETFYQDGFNIFPGGGIMLDLTDKTLPIVVPFVPSGAYEWEFGQFYMTTQAGYYKYLQNVPTDQVKAFLEENKFTLPTMDDQFMVTLPNCRYCSTTNMYMPTQWTRNKVPVEMVSQIQLPREAVVGVEGIVNDADVNAPVRYFNLQGVEVAAPAKGEVVVKKQGSKATKVVF